MTRAPVANAADYLWAFQKLLPRGRVWQRGWGTMQAAYLLTLMPTWARLHMRGNDLLTETFPCTTDELLPEWEASLGLPDPCVQPPLATVQQRQDAVCAKFKARGGCSLDYFANLIETLGYPLIEIQLYRPFRVGNSNPGQRHQFYFCTGQNRVGDRLYSWSWDGQNKPTWASRVGDRVFWPDWVYVWGIVFPGTIADTYFRTGRSHVGERLRTAITKSNVVTSQLACLLTEIAPANTKFIFLTEVYSIWDGGASIWDRGASVWDGHLTG